MKIRKIFVPIVGGLGNQLFCLAYAVALTQRGHTVRIFSGVTRRQTALHPNDFDLCDKDLSNTDLPKAVTGWKRFLLSSTAKLLGALGRKNWLLEGTKWAIVDTKSHPTDISNPASTAMIVRGYFQSAHYSDLTVEILRNAIIILGTNNPIGRRAELIRHSRIAVHFRRGDYSNHTQTIGMLSVEYFAQACLQLRSLYRVNNVVIYTDGNHEELKLKLEDLGFSVDISDSTHSSPLSILIQMGSTSDHFVMSNSSFSWWAAAVGMPKSVICPSPWFRDSSIGNLARQGWIERDAIWET